MSLGHRSSKTSPSSVSPAGEPMRLAALPSRLRSSRGSGPRETVHKCSGCLGGMFVMTTFFQYHHDKLYVLGRRGVSLGNNGGFEWKNRCSCCYQHKYAKETRALQPPKRRCILLDGAPVAGAFARSSAVVHT